MSTIILKIEEEDKVQFSTLVKNWGLSVSAALSMIIKDCNRRQEIPVRLSLADEKADERADAELRAKIERSREEIKAGKSVRVETEEELDAFLDSL